MRAKRILTYFGAWLAATTAAGTLTWLGVRDVMHETVIERPGPLPATDSSRTPPPTDAPDAANPGDGTPATGLDGGKPGAAKLRGAEPGSGQPDPADPNATTPGTAAQDGDGQAPGSGRSPDIRNYDVDGGRAVLSVRADRAELVSAVPRPGYGVRTWEGTGWLRVEFRRGEQSSSVIAAWHDHPPRISTRRR